MDLRRLGWTRMRTGPVVVVTALVVGVFWWLAAEAVFQGTARSLLGVDAAALALGGVGAFFAAPRWPGRAAAWLAICGLAVVGLGLAYLVVAFLFESTH